jgi:hypothetical protein
MEIHLIPIYFRLATSQILIILEQVTPYWNILHVNQVGELADEIDIGC